MTDQQPMRSRHLSQVIRRPPATVYAFAAEPANLTLWAAGLVQAEVRRDGADLLADTPGGQIRIRFAAPNELGVLDHDVTTPDGVQTFNPFRVLPHPEGSEVLFALRQLALSDTEFDRDAGMVQSDLDRLRDLLEGA
ncbi:SRPBCC family protein [Microlunatus sp. GCM10028923]|uniref:SRPBCC family protein n=1 Tax=Microlunatus sp. GCM10028923 TaxID=3273400 RepID=UPI00360C61FE